MNGSALADDAAGWAARPAVYADATDLPGAVDGDRIVVPRRGPR